MDIVLEQAGKIAGVEVFEYPVVFSYHMFFRACDRSYKNQITDKTTRSALDNAPSRYPPKRSAVSVPAK